MSSELNITNSICPNELTSVVLLDLNKHDEQTEGILLEETENSLKIDISEEKNLIEKTSSKEKKKTSLKTNLLVMGILGTIAGITLWMTNDSPEQLKTNLGTIGAGFLINAVASNSRAVIKEIPFLSRYLVLGGTFGVGLGIGLTSSNPIAAKACLILSTICALTGLTTIKTQMKKRSLGKDWGKGDEILEKGMNSKTLKQAFIGDCC